jgi:hypothetical protein
MPLHLLSEYRVAVAEVVAEVEVEVEADCG